MALPVDMKNGVLGDLSTIGDENVNEETDDNGTQP